MRDPPSPSYTLPPSENNPILNAYETFHHNTPFVTRSILSTQALMYALSFIVNITFSLANIPIYTAQQWEVYRLFTSLFLCDTFLSLVFVYFSFVETGKRLEQSMGSTGFGILFLTIGVLTNILYVGMAVLFQFVFGIQHFFVLPTFGVWLALFGLTAFESAQAPTAGTSSRKLFLFVVPTIYYPLALLAFFSILGGFSTAYLISIGVGYAFGYGRLDALKVSSARCRVWEEAFLEGLTHADGWVLANAALGSGAWANEHPYQQQQHGASPAMSLRNVFSNWTASSSTPQQRSNDDGTVSLPMGSEDSRPGRVIKSSPSHDNATPLNNATIPFSGGHKLGRADTVGGRPSRRTNTDVRIARLKAIEKESGGGGSSSSRDHSPGI